MQLDVLGSAGLNQRLQRFVTAVERAESSTYRLACMLQAAAAPSMHTISFRAHEMAAVDVRSSMDSRPAHDK